ncbi:MAG: HU family DNA-binding protein [Rhodobacter sp.]|nr:HU family DNA-binding protein [Rhodobacter sp.]
MARKPTTARKTTTRRTTKPRTKPAAATAAREAEATKTPTHAADPVGAQVAGKILGKRELIDRVVTASGIKKSAAKPVIEAMLRELGEALSQGDTLNLQPLGKGIVKNRKDLENAEVIELRLRRSKLAIKAAAAPRPDPLAEAAE